MSGGARDGAASIRSDDFEVRRYADAGVDGAGERQPVHFFVDHGGDEFGPFPSRQVALAAATATVADPEDFLVDELRDADSLDRPEELSGAIGGEIPLGNCDGDNGGGASSGDGDGNDGGGGNGGGGSSDTASVGDTGSTSEDHSGEEDYSSEDRCSDDGGRGEDSSNYGRDDSIGGGVLDLSSMPVPSLFPSLPPLVESAMSEAAVSDSAATLDVEVTLFGKANMFFETTEREFFAPESPTAFVEGGGLVGDARLSPENPFGLPEGFAPPPGLLRGWVSPDPHGILGEELRNPFSISEEHMAVASRPFSAMTAPTSDISARNEIETKFDWASF